MAEQLRALRRDTFQGGDSAVFTVENGRTAINRSNLSSRVSKPTVRNLGLPWVSFKTFRHTCVLLLFDEGRNVRQVAERLGHADPAFTLRTYVHLLDDGLGDAAFLDEAVEAEQPLLS